MQKLRSIAAILNAVMPSDFKSYLVQKYRMLNRCILYLQQLLLCICWKNRILLIPQLCAGVLYQSGHVKIILYL